MPHTRIVRLRSRGRIRRFRGLVTSFDRAIIAFELSDSSAIKGVEVAGRFSVTVLNRRCDLLNP